MEKTKKRLIDRIRIKEDNTVRTSDVVILSVCILLYMLTCVSGALNNVAQLSRYFILPLLIVFAYMSLKRIYFDTASIVLFLLAVTPSILFSDYFSSAVVKASTVLLMFVAASMFFYSRGIFGIKALYYALLILSYVAVSLNFFAYITGQGRLGRYFRGYFGNRNALGAALVMCIVILFAEFWRTKHIIPLAFTVITAVLIVSSESRGAFLGMIIGIVVFLLLAVKNKISFIFIALVSTTIVIIFWGSISQLDIIQRLLKEGATRDDLWNFAMQVIDENYLVGVGFSSSQFTNTMAGNEGMNFHNSYIGMMADVGIIGVLLLIAMFIHQFYRIYLNYKGIDENHRVYFLALVALCASFFGLSFGEAYLIVAGSPFSFTFWCCMFCLLHCNNLGRANSFLTEKKKRTLKYNGDEVYET